MNITFEFACLDDCLDNMVPSDLRKLVIERDYLLDEVERLRAALIFIRDKEEAALTEAEKLRFNIPEDAGCMEILQTARAALDQQK